MGDCFSCHAVLNPDTASEVDMLRSYAPELPEKLLLALAMPFKEINNAILLITQRDLYVGYNAVLLQCCYNADIILL